MVPILRLVLKQLKSLSCGTVTWTDTSEMVNERSFFFWKKKFFGDNVESNVELIAVVDRWDYEKKNYIDMLTKAQGLMTEKVLRGVSLTGVDTVRAREISDSGVKLTTLQVCTPLIVFQGQCALKAQETCATLMSIMICFMSDSWHVSLNGNGFYEHKRNMRQSSNPDAWSDQCIQSSPSTVG